MSDSNDQILIAVDARLRHVENQVAEIHRALVGSTDGTSRGLQSRVEKLEAWSKWFGGIVSALVIGVILQIIERVHP